MAITDLFINDGADRSVVYPSWVCRVSTSTASGPGAAPSDHPSLKSEISTQIKPRKVSISAGGGTLDYASVEWVDGIPLVNRTAQPASFSKMLDVLLPSRLFLGFDDQVYIDAMAEGSEAFAAFYLSAAFGNNMRLFVGDYVTESESVDATETLTGQIAVMDVHFGNALDGMEYFDDGVVYATPYVVSSDEIVFNPEIDGSIRGNKSSLFSSFAHYFIDPESGESAAALTYLGQTVSEWSLPEAVAKICAMCNPDENYIRNPVIDEGAALWTDAPAVKNVVMVTGQYLPYYLDALLHPLGYNWWVNANTNTVDTGGDDWSYQKPIITIFRKGWSPDAAKELNFQAPGEQLDLSETNVAEYTVNRKIADAYNCVRTLGGKIRVEGTFPLYPGWRNSEDAFTADELAISDGSQYDAHKTAHRLWICNEWAGYTGNRTEGGTYPVGDPPLFGQIFAVRMTDRSGADVVAESVSQVRKRVPEPPLTYQGSSTDKVRRDILLQYSEDSGTTWIEVSSKIGGWAVLGDQMGIIFTDDKPPQVIMDAFEAGTLKMRMTCTVASDHNLYNAGTDSVDVSDPASVQGRQRRLTLNRADTFRHWYVLGKSSPDASLDASPYVSVLADDVAGAEEYDDREALAEYSDAQLRNIRHAEFDATFVLPGWHTEYKIGDLLSKINGREVGLNQSADSEDPRYLQITGIEWELSDDDGPTTRIIVDRGINEVRRIRTPTYGPTQLDPIPLPEVISYEVQNMLRKEAMKADAGLNTSASAMDRLRGTIR